MTTLFTESRVALVAKAIAVAFLIAFIATLANMRDMMLSTDRGFGGDFIAFYAAGTLAREGRPEAAYDMATITETEKRALPQATYALMYAYPPVFQMVLKPLAGLPYVWAYIVWATVLFALHVAVWRVAFGNSPAFWAALGSSTVYLNVLHGQNGLLSAALLGIGLLSLGHRPLLAGLAIGALCYKPQLGISVGLLLLAGGQWRAVGGAALSVLVLCAASAAVLGLDVWRAFIEHGGSARIVLEGDGGPLDKIASVYSLARKLGSPVAIAYGLHAIVALAVIALAIRTWRRAREGLPRIAMAAATIPLVSPYLFDYDLAVIVLPIGVLLIDGFRNGWMPGMRIVLPIAWIVPAIAPKLAEITGLQIMPLASIALFLGGVAAMRVRDSGNRTGMMDLKYFAVVFGAFLLAGLVKGTAGMGLPPTAIALTTLVLPMSDALALLTVPTLATNLWQAFWGGHFRSMLRRFWIMGLAITIGIFVSALTLRSLGSPRSVGWLGVILVIFSLTAFVAWRPHVSAHHEWWANPLAGLATGLVGGVTGMAAIPFLPYIQSLSLTRDELIQALGILFVVFTAALTIALADAGAFTITNGVGTLVATAPTFLGVWLGQKLRRAVSPEVFRRMFLAVMFGVGIHLSRGLF